MTEEPVRGANWYSRAKTGLGNVIGNNKAEMLKNVKRLATSKYSPLGDLLDSAKSLRPVYKVMITMPSKEGSNVESYRYILADTSRPYVNFLAKSDSPVIGMWNNNGCFFDKALCVKGIVVVQCSTRGLCNANALCFSWLYFHNWLFLNAQ